MVKTKSNKDTTRIQYDNILKNLKEDVFRLEKELVRYVSTPRIAMGIRKNLRDRKEDVQYYQNLIKEYEDEGWINKKSVE